jgi:hypothetical protein
MGEFFSDLKSILGPRMLWEVVLGMRRNDLLGLVGQLAYFFLLFFFPFLIFLVSLTGLVIGNPGIPAKSALSALLVPLFGLFQKGNSPKVAPHSGGWHHACGGKVGPLGEKQATKEACRVREGEYLRGTPRAH